MLRSEAYKEALRVAGSSGEVQQIIGDNIHPTYPVFGHLIHFQDSDFAELSVRLVGSRGHGHLYGVANRINGVWEFSRLTFRSDGHAEEIDLSPVRRLNLPPAPSQKVYLIPIGLDPGQSLDWMPKYYRSKLGIEVSVLPAVPLDSKLIDPVRKQLDADKAIKLLHNSYPELEADASAILIEVTSSDMYIPGFNWKYAENLRSEGRFAIISAARFHPPVILEQLNPEWLNSRLEKLLTKNIASLYFGLPLSSDYSSLMSGGVLSGLQIDRMGGEIIGGQGAWNPFEDPGGPAVTIYNDPANTLWRWGHAATPLPDLRAQVFTADLGTGLLIQRTMDFVSREEPAMQLVRVHRNQDERSRSFGIGASHSFDMFLDGKMGVQIDLIMADGHRVRFFHVPYQPTQEGDTYRAVDDCGCFTEAVYVDPIWKVKSNDGWTYLFPYRPNAIPRYVTVLTGFIDPEQHKYEMERDSFGALIAVKSPSGKWLHFENDVEHRVHRISSSWGRNVQYDYDPEGCLVRATDSDGFIDNYTCDDKGEMLTAAYGNEHPFLINEYSSDGYITGQTMSGNRKFEYDYSRESNILYENRITDPNGLETYVRYVDGGYQQWLPVATPH